MGRAGAFFTLEEPSSHAQPGTQVDVASGRRADGVRLGSDEKKRPMSPPWASSPAPQTPHHREKSTKGIAARAEPMRPLPGPLRVMGVQTGRPEGQPQPRGAGEA